jgi:DNA invertase Pin-like site-specific DNA recombinase
MFRRKPVSATGGAPTPADGDPRAATASPEPKPPTAASTGVGALASAQLAAGAPVIGYVTVDRNPAREREAFAEIEALCEQAGWQLEGIVRDRETGRMVERPGLTFALERIAARDARGLVVSDARSLVGSLGDLSELLEWFRDAEAALIAVNLDLDFPTIPGHPTASTLVAVAGWQGARTATRAQGGRAPDQGSGDAARRTPDDRAALIDRIRALREAGMSLEAIADQFVNEGVPSPRGDTGWRSATVQDALDAPPRCSVRDEPRAILSGADATAAPGRRIAPGGDRVARDKARTTPARSGLVCQIRWLPRGRGSRFSAVTIDADGVERSLATSPHVDWPGRSPPEQSREAQAALRHLAKTLRNNGWRPMRVKGKDFNEQRWYSRRFRHSATEPGAENNSPAAASEARREIGVEPAGGERVQRRGVR